jgi:ABC-type glucose/galactose transport system permease subunit
MQAVVVVLAAQAELVAAPRVVLLVAVVHPAVLTH